MRIERGQRARRMLEWQMEDRRKRRRPKQTWRVSLNESLQSLRNEDASDTERNGRNVLEKNSMTKTSSLMKLFMETGWFEA